MNLLLHGAVEDLMESLHHWHHWDVGVVENGLSRQGCPSIKFFGAIPVIGNFVPREADPSE